MSKPRKYVLEQNPTSEGYMQSRLELSCGDGDRDIYIETNHTIHLQPRSARALAKPQE